MMELYLLIIIMGIYFLFVYFDVYEKFTNYVPESNLNQYFIPLKNIFLGDNYYNYQLNHPEIKENTESLGKITFDSYLYSKPTTQKIICSSHTNRADCWEDNVNNCQWIHKIDGGSYCDVALIWLL